MQFARELEGRYTYADLLTWDDGKRYELYDGEPVALASPLIPYQRISAELYVQLHEYLRGKRCEAFYAPADVRLFEREGDRPEDVKVVVQPDIFVVCDPNKLDDHGCKGAPDLVIEILSPSKQKVDRLVKYKLYQQAGVPEYWIVDPVSRIVSVHTLEDGCYGSPVVYNANTKITVGVLKACEIDLTMVFPDREV